MNEPTLATEGRSTKSLEQRVEVLEKLFATIYAVADDIMPEVEVREVCQKMLERVRKRDEMKEKPLGDLIYDAVMKPDIVSREKETDK